MLKATFRVGIVLMLFLMLFLHNVKAQIAPGVQQSAAQTASITGTLVQNDGTPVAGADVRLTGPAMLTTKSDAHGTFNFTSVPYGVYRIVAIAANLGTASRENLIVKGDISVAIQYVAQSGTSPLKEIARVSTHSAGAQINVTPANITSIGPSEYAFQGNASWKELLGQIPGVAVGGNLQGGEVVNDIIPDSPFQPIVLSINGALPYETSVMFDGMPLINTSFAGHPGNGSDLAFLPMPMFDTADIVRGPGANAPSIVDSIGGSFVLHAPGQVDKNQFEFSASTDPYGGIVSNARAALRFGKLSAVITYGVNNSPGPLGNQNIISASTPVPLTVNGQAFLGCTPPSGCSTYINPSGPQYSNCSFGCELQDSLLFSGVPVNTVWRQHNGAIGLSYNISSLITAQIFYAGSSSKMQQPWFELPVNFTPGAGYSGSILPGLHSYISATLNPLEASQASSLLEEKMTAYMGHGVLRFAALQNNSFQREIFPDCLPNGQYVLYGSGYYTSAPGTVVNFNGTSAYLTFTPFIYDNKSWVNNRDLLLSYAMQVGSRSNISVSYVTSYYNYPSTYNITFGPFVFSGGEPTAISETTSEIRLNAGTEVSDKLALDASWYFTRGAYHIINPADPNTWVNSTFPYTAPRIGAVWHVNQNAAIRVAAGGGFALPPISNLVGTNGTPFCTTTCNVTLTNLNLTPEKSFGFDLGADIRFHRDTVLSFDLYHTNLYGQFFQSTNLTGTYSGLPLYTTQYNNLTQSRFEGINVDIRHDVPKGIYWHGALGLTRAYVVSVPIGFYDQPGAPNSVNTYIIPGINFDGPGLQSPVPYTNGGAQIGYRWSPEKYIDFSPTYYGKNNTYFEPAFLEFDVHVGYPLTKNVALLASFRNITGIYGQNYQRYVPSMGAPTVAGPPYALFGLPYGPRTVILTANFKY